MTTSNQPCFEGGALLLDQSITQQREFLSYDGDVLSSRYITELTVDEDRRYENACLGVKASVQTEANDIREKWLASREAEMINKGVDPKLVKQILVRAINGSGLYSDFVICTDKFGEITISEILTNPVKYHNATCADPLDPGYGKNKAKIYSNQDIPCINSMAHGINTSYFIQRSITDDFDDVSGALATTVSQRNASTLERNRAGKFEATIVNVVVALSDHNFINIHIGYDEFRDEIMFHQGDHQWQAFGDAQYTELRMRLATRGFKEVGRELIRDAIYMVAIKYKFDSAKVWLESLKWDGVSRIETFNARYLKAEDSPYTRAVAMYMWTAMAGRVFVPGIQADMVPIWLGEQGMIKSGSAAALVPSANLFCEISFNESEDNLARKMRGTLVGEIGELRGLHTRDLESIKQFITRRDEKWTPKFKEFTTTFPRRLIFIGTTNQSQFLADSTGNRRWLPFSVGKADRDAIVSDRDQLWAEAAHRFEIEGGILWQDAERLARDVHAQYELTDPWEDPIKQWLITPSSTNGTTRAGEKDISTHSILINYLNFEAKNIQHFYSTRVATVMTKLGYVKRQSSAKGRPYVWNLKGTQST